MLSSRQPALGVILHERTCCRSACQATCPLTRLLQSFLLLLFADPWSCQQNQAAGWKGHNSPVEGAVAADILFACTACLDCSNINFYHLVRGLHSVITVERNGSSLARLMDVVVVNEVRPPGSRPDRWSRAVQKLWPQVVFVQKEGRKQRGQAHSLNVILRMLADRGAKYWLHWEESWRAEVPFLARAIGVLEAKPAAAQVDLGPGWSAFEAEEMSAGGRLLKTKPGMLECNWTLVWGGISGFDRGYWPLFTLHPSLNRVDRMLATPGFSEDPERWPVIFEFDWACKLVRSGATKGVLVPPPVTRQSGHFSSYQRLPNLRRLGICSITDEKCSNKK